MADTTPRHLTLFTTAEFQFDDRFATRSVTAGKSSGSGASVQEYLAFARELEQDGFDAVLVADFLGINRKTLGGNGDGPFGIRRFEPLTRLAALAVATERIGLIGTFSTQFTEPYNLARQLASLDHLSGGRAAWNIVTSFTSEKNFGLTQLPSPSERYERAQEYLDVVAALWNSWAPDYEVERPDGTFGVDADRIVDIDHDGQYFSVQQAIDIPPTPQRIPVLVQAGSSAAGTELAGKNAEVVYVATPDLESAIEYSNQLAGYAAAAGRDRSHIRVSPGVRLYLGETHDEAQAAYLSVLTDQDLIAAKQGIKGEIPTLNLDDLDLDAVLPIDRFPSEDELRAGGRRTSRALIYRSWAASGEYPTVRAFLTRFGTSFGHAQFIGTPEEVADTITEWFRSGAIDSFTVHSANSYELLTTRVFPILRERGVLPPRPGTGTPTQTFRERIGTTLSPRHIRDYAAAVAH